MIKKPLLMGQNTMVVAAELKLISALEDLAIARIWHQPSRLHMAINSINYARELLEIEWQVYNPKPKPTNKRKR